MEFLQKANDAGTTILWVILDETQNHSERLPCPEMAVLQGHPPIIFNDATFTNKDLERLQQIGGSGKALETSKTGRFGFGFNAVYNVTDTRVIAPG